MAAAAGSGLATTEGLAAGPVLTLGTGRLAVLDQRNRRPQPRSDRRLRRDQAGSADSVAAVVLVAGLASLGPDGSSSGTPGAAVTTTVTVTTERQVPVAQPPATVTRAGPTVTVVRSAPLVRTTDALYYANCAEARAAGDTPLFVGDPGYAGHLDRDKDGVACE